MPEKVAIVGSRDFKHLDMVWAYVQDLPPDTTVVSGGARGVDRAAEQAAVSYGLARQIIRAIWRNDEGVYNPKAGFERNTLVVEAADRIVAFWDGRSGGTLDTIKKARLAGKPVEIIQHV